MTLEQLDAQIAYWSEASRLIVANVYELYEHSTYRSLTLDLEGPAPAITGITLQRVQAAVDAVKDLLVLSLEVDGVVKRAANLRGSMPLLFQTAAMGEIEALLAGPSINLVDAQTPLAERGLLSQARQGRALTPQQLLDLMQPAFESAKCVILDIDEAWTRLPGELDALEAALGAVESAAAAEGAAALFSFGDLHARLAAARANVMTDPLGLAADAHAGLEGEIRALKARVDGRAEDRRRVVVSLREALRLLLDVQANHERAQTIHAECVFKVESAASALPAPAAEARIAKLIEWQAKLQAAVDRGEWQPARVGLENWRAAAQETAALDTASLRGSEERLNARKELRGRLDGLQAKASTLGCTEDAALGKLCREINALLARRPSPLPEIERLLGDYQRAVTVLTAGRAVRRSE